MAKIEEQFIIIKMSKLFKDNESVSEFVKDEVVESVRSIIDELIDNEGIITEISTEKS